VDIQLRTMLEDRSTPGNDVSVTRDAGDPAE
jgi:hypothetical protein